VTTSARPRRSSIDFAPLPRFLQKMEQQRREAANSSADASQNRLVPYSIRQKKRDFLEKKCESS
jgi:hypothetical protein